MTDTLHKNPESCTVCNTPETDAVLIQYNHHLPNWLASEIMAAVARRLERERNEARFDLSFRRDLYKLQESQLDELRKQLAEATNSCNIWQRSHKILVECRDDWKRLAVEQEQDIKEWKLEVERWRTLGQVYQDNEDDDSFYSEEFLLRHECEKLRDALEGLVLDSALFCDNMKSHKQAKEALEEWKH
jgi:hypothetical protein